MSLPLRSSQEMKRRILVEMGILQQLQKQDLWWEDSCSLGTTEPSAVYFVYMSISQVKSQNTTRFRAWQPPHLADGTSQLMGARLEGVPASQMGIPVLEDRDLLA